MQTTEGRPGARQEWADLAKAVCIVLVVTYHLTLFSYADLAGGRSLDNWYSVNDVLQPVRMPLFFVVSGFFAAAAVHRPWPAVVRNRVVRPYYLYVVWLLVQTAVFTALPENLASRDWVLLPLHVLVGTTWLWYFYALAAYFVVVKVLRHRPVLLVLGSGALSVVAYTGAIPTSANGTSLLRNVVFFALGALAPRAVELVRDRATVAVAVGSTTVFLALSAVATKAGLSLVVGVGPVLSAAGVVAGIALAVVAVRVEPVARAAVWLGSRTMPIYVMHVPLLIALDLAVTAWLGPRTWAYPLWGTALVVGACLALHALLSRAAPWLFGLPRPRADRPRAPRPAGTDSARAPL